MKDGNDDALIAYLAKETAEEHIPSDDRDDKHPGDARFCGGCREFLCDFEHYIETTVDGQSVFTPSGFCCDCFDKKPVLVLIVDNDIPF